MDMSEVNDRLYGEDGESIDSCPECDCHDCTQQYGCHCDNECACGSCKRECESERESECESERESECESMESNAKKIKAI